MTIFFSVEKLVSLYLDIRRKLNENVKLTCRCLLTV